MEQRVESLKYSVKIESKLRWRTPLQATGYVRDTAIVVMEY
jgi:hypothetical protein